MSAMPNGSSGLDFFTFGLRTTGGLKCHIIGLKEDVFGQTRKAWRYDMVCVWCLQSGDELPVYMLEKWRIKAYDMGAATPSALCML